MMPRPPTVGTRALWFCLGFLAGAGMAYWSVPPEAWNVVPLIDWTRTA